MKASPAMTAVLLFAAILPPRLAAQGFPGLAPDSRAAEFARRGARGDYSWEDLAEMALWASGVGEGAGNTAAQNTANMNTLRQAVAELRASGEMQGAARDAAAAGDYILTYMHRKFLKSYAAMQTRMDTLLFSGRYNCVSSAVLYLILAQSQGLTVRGVITRDHAFATVYGPGEESWDVETTNAYGFDPGNRREFHDQFGKATGFAYVPARNYRDRTSVSPLELVSLILSNRIAEQESRGRYAESVPLAVNRAGMLAGRASPAAGFFTDPQQDLRDRLLNYGASLLNSGKEEEGLRWAAHAETVFLQAGGRTDSRWQEYISALANNRVAKLCRSRHFEEARSFLTNAQTMLDPVVYRSLETLITDNEITTQISGMKQADEAIAILARLEKAEASGILTAVRARELRDHITRWRLIDFHNRFAAAFNKRDYTLARRILDEALAEFPDNRQLHTDRGSLDRALGGA
jgi:hypothetical protein